MVNIVIENLLTTARNRALYQALWSLSLTKTCKPENLKSCENISITAICNELMLEIRSHDPDPNQFFFSSHLAFGVIELYRFQIDKLLKQVKNALTSCKSTFFEIDWLSRMSETQQAEDTQPSFVLSIKKTKVPKKRSHEERDRQPLAAEIDLIDNVLMIPDVPEVVVTKTRKNDSIDTTMARSERDITIAEKYQPRRTEDFRGAIEDEFDEFGGAFQQEFETFFGTTAQKRSFVKEQDQEVPELELDEGVPDMLRSAENQRAESPSYELLEPTLSNDVMDIVRKQLPRKRSLSQAFDISERLERASKVVRFNPASEDNNHNISPFASTANAIENVVNFEADVLEIPLVTSPAAAKKTRKPRQKKRKLVIDKIMKLTEKELKDDLAQYKEKLTNPSPMETFDADMMLFKHSAETFWEAPGTRLKFCAAKQLLPLFKRNLRVLKHKRPQVESNEVEENSPPKKRKLRERIVAYQEIDEIEIVPELPVIEEIVYGISELDLPVEDFPVKKKNKKSELKEISTQDYQEKEKWSKHKIMNSLNDFWKNSDEPVTMPKFCAKTNRFVAAGIFFELMVLSKEEAVELTQGDGLKITNISMGRNVEIYI